MRARHLVAEAMHRTGVWRLLRETSAYRILMYHRVLDPQSLPYPIEPGMYVLPDTFFRHCQFLKRELNVLPLSELVDLALARKRPPPRAIAITFDDGYLDFFQNALPHLKTLELPATVFLPTAFIGTNRMFAYDLFAAELERARAHPELRKNLLDIFKESALNDSLLASYADLYLHSDNVAVRAEILAKMLYHLKQLDRTKRSVVLDAVATLSEPGFYPRTFMNWDEVRQSQDAGITFASHSHNHFYLDEVGADEILEDTQIARDLLAKQRIAALDYYCFPNGNFTPASLTLLSGLGVQASFGTGRIATQLHQTPLVFSRLGVHEDISTTVSDLTLRIFTGR